MKAAGAHPGYRPDIDGLRAVAVLAVVAFHAFPARVKGGFVGVDVFFVISGYLISKILVTDLDRGRFSIAAFYSRRVRRIFPALGVVLGACMLAGWLVLLPTEYEQLGKHVAAGAGFVSNLVLWSEAGYFDSSAATKPLLHLWSLGIEEQFYIVWPLLLWLARKRGMAAVLLGLTAMSFVVSLLVLRVNPVAAFYNPLTRFWELLIGALLAYVTLRTPAWLFDERRGAREVASLTGAVLIAAAVVCLDADQPFPGWRALLPTVGAYLVIASGPHAAFNRYVLSQRLLVWVGLISFPLYLWHWPLLAFVRIIEAGPPLAKPRIIAVAASFVLAGLTYRLVERPLRFGKREKPIVTALCASLALLAVGGLALLGNGGFAAARGPWNVSNISQSFDFKDQFNDTCRSVHDGLFSPSFEPELDLCHASVSPPSKAEVVVLGDSHAGRLYTGLQEATTIPVLGLGRASCLPFSGYEATTTGGEALKCLPTSALITDRVIADGPRVAVVTGFFARPYDGRVVARVNEPLRAVMRETLARLSAHLAKVVVVLDVPELPFDPSYCVDRPFTRGAGRGRCAFSRTAPDQQLALYEGDLRAATEGLPNVSFYNPADELCDATSCFVVMNENLLYDDRNHLSRYGAAMIAKALAPRLR